MNIVGLKEKGKGRYEIRVKSGLFRQRIDVYLWDERAAQTYKGADGARVEKTVEGKLRTFLISKKLSGK